MFRLLKTKNFELVLRTLNLTQRTNQCLGIQDSKTSAVYENIKGALFSAVHEIHPPWNVVCDVLSRIRNELRGYQWVFSTNYDLLAYWSIVSNHSGFVDFFWNQDLIFDRRDTRVDRPNDTKVLYLHGGLHLEESWDGVTKKRRREDAAGLLSTQNQWEDSWPLFVSEGTWQDKARVIDSNDYLSFANGTFSRHEGCLVVFGHRLSKTGDDHLVKAIRSSDAEKIAISVNSLSGPELITFKSRLQTRLLGHELLFFRSSSHPLGNSSLWTGPEDDS